MPTEPAYLTPEQFAKPRGIGINKVLTFIRNGELAAVNFATKRGGRPRWRIPPEAVEKFEAGRRNVAPPITKPVRRRKAIGDVPSIF